MKLWASKRVPYSISLKLLPPPDECLLRYMAELGTAVGSTSKSN